MRVRTLFMCIFFVRVYITFGLITETSTIESVVFNDNAID